VRDPENFRVEGAQVGVAVDDSTLVATSNCSGSKGNFSRVRPHQSGHCCSGDGAKEIIAFDDKSIPGRSFGSKNCLMTRSYRPARTPRRRIRRS